MTNSDQVFYSKLENELTKLFDMSKPMPGICNDMPAGELSPAWSQDDEELYGILEFKKGNFYVVKSYWEEENFPEYSKHFDFPVVAYSEKEIKSWLSWSMYKCISFFPNHKLQLLEILNKFVDEKPAFQILMRKLDLSDPWEFGATGHWLSQRDEWVARTKEPKGKAWVKNWIPQEFLYF